MGAPLPRSVLRQPPQDYRTIDRSNPLTAGLVFAYVCSTTALGFGEDGRSQLFYYNSGGIQEGISIITPIGRAVQALAGSSYAVNSPTQYSVKTGVYSLFAVGTATSSVVQSALDDDDGTSRKFQFRLNNGKAEFIPFNSGGVAADVIAPTALSAASLANGFTMGATINATTAAVYQNGQKTSAAASGVLAPNSVICIGARKTGTNQVWGTGGLSLVAMWNRTLSDVEMQLLNDNPWQLFKAPSNLPLIAALYANAVANTIQQKALYVDSNGVLRQSTGGLSIKPLVLVNGNIQARQAAEGTPIVLVNGSLRLLAAGETLVV